jgi:hypothetical protein
VADSVEIAALAEEHLPDSPASVAEFATFFSCVVALESHKRRSDHVVADVLAWMRADGAVQHEAVFRVLESGELYCRLEFAIDVPVAPLDLDEHAEGIAAAFTQAFNQGEADDLGRGNGNDSE